jgi:FkbM family methyltransferase
MTITTRRKARLLDSMFARAPSMIGFADVGSGGPLKAPWSLLPKAHLRKFDFEPTDGAASGLPLCISNRSGRAPFNVAHDERGSSFHAASAEFVKRFDMPSLNTKHVIEVECATLDAFFAGRFADVDAMDINVEGHDFQALEGARTLLTDGFVKLIKIEFETAEVWRGQGWLGDIDALLRGQGYVMTDIDIEFARAANARSLFHRGEPLWGKALYVPGPARWETFARSSLGSGTALEDALVRAIALYVAADQPGHALDAVARGAESRAFTRLDATHLRDGISQVYRWAKMEKGVQELASLVSRATGLGRRHV